MKKGDLLRNLESDAVVVVDDLFEKDGVTYVKVTMTDLSDPKVAKHPTRIMKLSIAEMLFEPEST